MTLSAQSTHAVSDTVSAAPTSVDLHPALAEVRRMPEFQPPPDWMDGLYRHPLAKRLLHEISAGFDGFAKALQHWFSHLGVPGLAHLPESIRDIFNGLLLFCLALLVLYGLYFLLGFLLGLQRRGEKKSQGGKAPSEAPPVGSASHYDLAEGAARAGRYDAALRELYFAALRLLDERTVVPYAESATTGEYRERLSRLSEERMRGLLAPFEHIARLFEVSRYGLRPAPADAFERSSAGFVRMRELLAPSPKRRKETGRGNDHG